MDSSVRYQNAGTVTEILGTELPSVSITDAGTSILPQKRQRNSSTLLPGVAPSLPQQVTAEAGARQVRQKVTGL